jgi:hypothetical protein
MQFVDEIMAPNDDFLTVCKCTAREIARQVSACSRAWDPRSSMGNALSHHGVCQRDKTNTAMALVMVLV